MRKEVEVKYFEGKRDALAYSDLFQKRVEENVDWDRRNLLEHFEEIEEHEFTSAVLMMVLDQ